tara:strand:+ start:246 stop:434 length:189 start_codon:yes stop_codon:yes gene_type:complete
MRSYIEINRSKKEWKAKYKELTQEKWNYRNILNSLRTAELTNEVIGQREALKELISELNKKV